MGFGIKIGNPIKSVTSAVTSAVKTVTNTVERSDIGKVVKVAVEPVSTANEMRKDIFKGKFESAGNRALGAAASLNPVDMAIRSSSTVKGIFERDSFFGSYAQSSDAFNKLKSGQSLTADESKVVALTFGKSAAMIGAAYGGAAYGKKALLFAGENKALTTLVASQVIKGSQSGDYSQAVQTIGNQVSPGLGDVGRNLLTPKQPGIGATFSSLFDTAPGTSGAAAQASSKTLFYAVGAVLLILILAIFKKMRS